MNPLKQFDASKVHVGRIPYGADIITSIEDYCAQHQIHAGWVSLLGALSAVTLAYYDQESHRYETKHFSGEYEILNGTGNISLKDGKPFLHMHLTLSDTQFHCHGGHLMKGDSQVFACEFAIHALTGADAFERQSDKKTGLTLWPCHGV